MRILWPLRRLNDASWEDLDQKVKDVNWVKSKTDPSSIGYSNARILSLGGGLCMIKDTQYFFSDQHSVSLYNHARTLVSNLSSML